MRATKETKLPVVNGMISFEHDMNLRVQVQDSKFFYIYKLNMKVRKDFEISGDFIG